MNLLRKFYLLGGLVAFVGFASPAMADIPSPDPKPPHNPTVQPVSQCDTAGTACDYAGSKQADMGTCTLVQNCNQPSSATCLECSLNPNQAADANQSSPSMSGARATADNDSGGGCNAFGGMGQGTLAIGILIAGGTALRRRRDP